eukprot:CAMPEP_0172818580 /NCGR_PEP_ID=MMETSP1075-20121228/14009_1 /TAXON_ID=2916 /ORGANISM="Ceratium fusus, Strain PA161109" /LENGTH=102 /DNA_ID=CAMNT_0013658955 /DNA_START=803 /DNA_END=1112 /DNA_ORIENTATION=-
MCVIQAALRPQVCAMYVEKGNNGCAFAGAVCGATWRARGAAVGKRFLTGVLDIHVATEGLKPKCRGGSGFVDGASLLALAQPDFGNNEWMDDKSPMGAKFLP